MLSFASNAIAGTWRKRTQPSKCGSSNAAECSDDEVSSCASREENLECPICWESFNLVENVPYVLWCGHTMCKNCILGLQWAVVKFPTLPIQLPLFISCPWCDVLSLRFIFKGNIKFPRKNYFLLWMVESMNGERVKSHTSQDEHLSAWPTSGSSGGCSHISGHQHNHRAPNALTEHGSPHLMNHHLYSPARVNASLQKLMTSFIQLTSKFPLVIIFLLIVIYAIPASAAVLALYALVTVLFALPSFLILYFAYPSLDWLVREIFN